MTKLDALTEAREALSMCARSGNDSAAEAAAVIDAMISTMIRRKARRGIRRIAAIKAVTCAPRGHGRCGVKIVQVEPFTLTPDESAALGRLHDLQEPDRHPDYVFTDQPQVSNMPDEKCPLVPI